MVSDKVRKITYLYYSKSDVQKAIFDFSTNREISAQYLEAFGKRPDSFQYQGDVFEMVKRGATSFHCSEELWEDPLKLSSMTKEQLNELRIGWDLVLDIDCKWFDYSKRAAKSIMEVFHNHGIKNIGIKFSGSKGFHILLPWKAFPKEIGGEKTKNLFPELPKKLVSYIKFKSEEIMKESLPEDFYNQFKNVEIKKGIKCNICKEIVLEYNFLTYHCPRCHRKELRKSIGEKIKEYKCPECIISFEIKDSKKVYKCDKCNVSSEENPDNFSKTAEVDIFELMGLDMILVSPRHLFRMPYSLHEKTSLASIVINEDEISNFQPKDADPLKVKIKNFMPEVHEGEAEKLVREALDWNKDNQIKAGDSENKLKRKQGDFEPVVLKNLSEKNFPPSIQKILKGMSDGRKRALFILINLFRSIGMDKDEFEKRIFLWNKQNKKPLDNSYINFQIAWSYKHKVVLPPNFDKDYYRGIGIYPTEEEMRYKNPVAYIVKKNLDSNK